MDLRIGFEFEFDWILEFEGGWDWYLIRIGMMGKWFEV